MKLFNSLENSMFAAGMPLPPNYYI